MNSKAIQDHPEWPEVIDSLKQFGNYSKEQLVNACYSYNKEDLTKDALRKYNRAFLLAMLIDNLHGD